MGTDCQLREAGSNPGGERPIFTRCLKILCTSSGSVITARMCRFRVSGICLGVRFANSTASERSTEDKPTGRPRTPGRSVSPTSSGFLSQKHSRLLPLHRRAAPLEKSAVAPSSTPREPAASHAVCPAIFPWCGKHTGRSGECTGSPWGEYAG